MARSPKTSCGARWQKGCSCSHPLGRRAAPSRSARRFASRKKQFARDARCWKKASARRLLRAGTPEMQVVLIGGGMIASDQILPSLFQLQRLGRIGDIKVCERRAEALDRLATSPQIRLAFP